MRHFDLQGVLWRNLGEVADNGVDDDENGFIDDVNGWNFGSNSPDPSGISGSEYGGDHGTAVAGAATAVADNGIGLAGTSWNARLMALNVDCSLRPATPCGYWQGITYSALNGADIINASYGGFGTSQAKASVMQAATDEGALLDVAAGNNSVNFDHFPIYPAAITMVLSVGGTLAESDKNYYNYGRSVNVFAAGRGVIVPLPGNTFGWEYGTSFASPLVAGVAALVKTANPHFSPHQVREQVRMTADNIDGVNGAALVGLLGRGRVNAYRAVTESGLPAVRMTKANWGGSEGALRSGDSVELSTTFTNYLANAENLTIEWFSDGDFVDFATGPIGIGTLVTAESTSVTTAFTLSEDTPYRARFFVSPRARAGSYDDAPDIVRLSANEGETLTHVTGGMELTITTEGNFGFLDDLYGRIGRGISAYDASNARRSILLEGGLLVATGPNAVSDCLYSDELELQILWQHMDLVPMEGARLKIREPGDLVAQEGRMQITDAGAPNPIGVTILQESFMDTADEHEDFVILRYTIENPTDREISNVHVGLMFDWWLNDDRYQDHAGFDVTRNMGFQQDAATSPRMMAGTIPLTVNAPVHYRALRREESKTDRTKWTYLTGGIQEPDSEANDWEQVTGLGPFLMGPGEEIQVAFAVVTGRNREDFFQNADNATALWESTIQQAPTAQFIQNVDGPAVDLYLDDRRLYDDWTFQSASAFEALSQGEHKIDVVAGSEADNASPLSSETIHIGTATNYHVTAHGKGEEVDIVVVEGVRRQQSPGEEMTFYVTHGAPDLGPVDLRLVQPGAEAIALLSDAAYGAVGDYVTLPPGPYDVELVVAADQRFINVFRFDLSSLSRQAFVLSLSGTGTSAREGLTMMGVQADGTIFLPFAVTRTDGDADVPETFVLHGNYPNPFNPATTILVDLPVAATVTVELIDLLGRTVMRSTPKELEAGAQRAIRLHAAQLASGTYQYRVRAAGAAGTEVRTGQMTILK